MVDRPAPANRVDHFAHLRESTEEPPKRQDPGLEYEKYRITPELIAKVTAYIVNETMPPTGRGLSPIEFALKLYVWRLSGDMGSRIIAKLQSLMLSQEQDQA
jgi:hypothetical protein